MMDKIGELKRLKKLVDPEYGWGPFVLSDTKLLVMLIDAEIDRISITTQDKEKLEQIKILCNGWNNDNHTSISYFKDLIVAILNERSNYK